MIREAMGEPEDELPPLPEPGAARGDDEEAGVEDADELLVADIPDGPETVGLDADTVGEDADEPLLVDVPADGASAADDDAPADVEITLEGLGDEYGWMADNDEPDANWDDGWIADEWTPDSDDDGGAEGVDEPQPWDDADDVSDLPPLARDEDEDDDDLEELGAELLRDWGGDAQEGA